MADKRQLALRRQQGAAADIREERLGRRSREIWNKAVWNEKNVYDDMEEIAENMEGLGI